MAKFSRGDMVRILEYRDSAFVGFEGVVTKVHEPSGGEAAPTLTGSDATAYDTGVAYYDVQIDMLNAPLSGIPEDDLELA